MNVGIKKPEKRLHSGQWKAICGLLVMVAAVSLVWAILASFSLWQRDRELTKAMEELIDLREDVRRMQEREIGDSSLEALLDDYLPPPDENDDPVLPDLDDPFAIFEEELGIIGGEE